MGHFKYSTHFWPQFKATAYNQKMFQICPEFSNLKLMINVSIFVLGNLVLLKMRASFILSKQSHPTLTSTKPQVTQGYPYRFWDGRGDICGGQGSDGGGIGA